MAKPPRHVYKKKVQYAPVSTIKDSIKPEPMTTDVNSDTEFKSTEITSNLTFVHAGMTMKSKAKAKNKIYIQDLDDGSHRQYPPRISYLSFRIPHSAI